MYKLEPSWPGNAHLKPAPWDSHGKQTSEKAYKSNCNPQLQICFFNAAAGKAFTIVFAGFAATFISLPKMFFTPAFVAGFTRVLMRHSPGIANTPVFLTSFEAMATKLLSTCEHVLVLRPLSVAMVFNRAPLVMAFAPAFMDFIGGNISLEKAVAPC